MLRQSTRNVSCDPILMYIRFLLFTIFLMLFVLFTIFLMLLKGREDSFLQLPGAQPSRVWNHVFGTKVYDTPNHAQQYIPKGSSLHTNGGRSVK